MTTLALQYDAATGVITYSGANTCNGVVQPGTASCGLNLSSCTSIWSYTPTTQSQAPTAVCCPDTGGNSLKASSANRTVTLSDEDLESDAINRLLAGAGGTWSAYTQVGDGTGGTCDPQSCCKAQYQQRTTGFSFAYTEAQFKAVMTLLDPLTAYVVTFTVYRRLQGSSGPWVLLLDSPFGFTTDASGNYTITDQDVPNLEGYETYICCPFVYKP